MTTMTMMVMVMVMVMVMMMMVMVMGGDGCRGDDGDDDHRGCDDGGGEAVTGHKRKSTRNKDSSIEFAEFGGLGKKRLDLAWR